jgi:hypothetical protein
MISLLQKPMLLNRGRFPYFMLPCCSLVDGRAFVRGGFTPADFVTIRAIRGIHPSYQRALSIWEASRIYIVIEDVFEVLF